jgi:putative glycosyltransferase (TIGR04372 family)
MNSFIKRQVTSIRKGGARTFIYKFTKIFYLSTSIFFLPLFIVIRLISNVVLIRFGSLPSSRIGHFAIDVNIYITNKKNFYNSFDFFCLQKPVSNYELLKLFKEYLLILPTFFIEPLIILNKIKIIGHDKHNILEESSGRDLRDRDFVNEINYNFNKKNISYGNSFLRNIGINNDDKFICLIVRDASYLKKYHPYKNWDYHNFRDSNIDNFNLVSDYLTNQGYYVFRMGAEVSKPMLTNNKKIIDYASTGMRNEFLDLFLAANCDFCITTGTGFEALPELFNKPLITVSFAPIARVRSVNKKHIGIFKHLINNNNKSLTLTEIFELNLADALDDKQYIEKKIRLIENSPEEIKEVTIEMLKLMQNNFLRDSSVKFLESKFWEIFNSKIKYFGFKYLHGNNFNAHIGENFLKKNINFIN